jgi:hypothetical protein
MKPEHARVVDILRHRGDRPSRVRLASGRTLVVCDVAWGYDLGDDVAHLTTNLAHPSSDEATVDFFRSDEVVSIDDVESGLRLFPR